MDDVNDEDERPPLPKCESCGTVLEVVKTETDTWVGDYCPKCNRLDPHGVQIGKEMAKPVT